MKGISPVVATVLLLLMAVASVGGAWVWYQRQSSIIGGETEEKLSEQIDQQKGSAVSLAGIYTSGSNVALIINNAGSSAVNITGYRIETGGSTVVNTSLSKEVGSKATSTHVTVDATCTTGNTVKIQLFTGGTSTHEFVETCP
jgi:flagellin-like protein